ncbi:34517_t:CDS:10 [Racocetra persica]|uniref:34517_t:CDS:1 n=1 Tax=Racocetra persica TaxID=160502 RepID=A0ACA9MMZ2_9GLOM|nr:34517_t:CDS:10 [Racocetra persica]
MLKNKISPSAIYTSRLLDFKKCSSRISQLCIGSNNTIGITKPAIEEEVTQDSKTESENNRLAEVSVESNEVELISQIQIPPKKEAYRLADADPERQKEKSVGTEIRKPRPAVIISNDWQNEVSKRVIVLPFSTNIEKVYYPIELLIRTGKIMCDQVKSIDKQRLGDKLGELDPATMLKVDETLVELTLITKFINKSNKYLQKAEREMSQCRCTNEEKKKRMDEAVKAASAEAKVSGLEECLKEKDNLIKREEKLNEETKGSLKKKEEDLEKKDEGGMEIKEQINIKLPCSYAGGYLSNKYPTQQEKEQGGELDLSEYPNLEIVEIEDQEYPKNGTCKIEKDKRGRENPNFNKKREAITELDINNCLTNLDLNNCKKLKTIWCSNNQLTTLNLSNLEQLEQFGCADNYLTQIIYPSNPENITFLDISSNKLSLSDLAVFNKFKNLEGLGNLGGLFIDNTDINRGWEYLPGSLEKIQYNYDTKLRPDCKLAQTKAENIEHIADGGFVALKTLTNSQDLNQDRLQELTFYKMFRSEISNIVPCYGVSKNERGDYVLVMKYMKDSSLKKYLQKNYQNLIFYNEYGVNSKLHFLKQITQGLKEIHRNKLVHRDFHSGNIIVDRGKLEKHNNSASFSTAECRITDLGLSRSADEVDNNQGLQQMDSGQLNLELNTQLLEKLKIGDTEELTIPDEQAETSLHTQIQIPPKQSCPQKS